MYRYSLDDKYLPGIYICKETGKGIIVEENRWCFFGSLKVKKKQYVYFQYRKGKKVIDKYLGKKVPDYWIKDGNYY